MNIRTIVIVKGLVQGVSFRYFTKMTAESLGVSGWVMNLPDGSVNACIEGNEVSVRALVDWCRRGPDHARVDELHISIGEVTGEFAGFAIRH